LQQCISGKKHDLVKDLFGLNRIFESVSMDNITPSCSETECILIQIADFFAGIGAYSWGHYIKFQEWKESQSLQLDLFGDKKEIELSNKEKVKFEVMDYLIKKQKEFKLSISFESTMGFKTNNPNDPINYWLYKPQSDNDKAPIKKSVIPVIRNKDYVFEDALI